MKLFTGKDGTPLFSSKRVLLNFLVLVLCSQFAFSVLAMKGALLPQMLELWQISKTQFGLLMSIYGIVHNIFYLALAWAQDRFSPRILIPVNMVLGGITTFFLGQTNDFATLCFLFVMLSLWCEGAFWPAILSSVRKSTSDSNQGKIFGLLEGGRGGIELLQNALTVGLYAWLGYSLLGLEIAFMVNAVIMIVLGIVSWFMLPTETLLKSGNDQKAANREVLAGMSVTLRLPEVWLAGIAGFGVYLAYTSMPFFLTYLQDLHALPVLAISIFGIVSTSGGRIGIALPSGFIADRYLGGASGGLRAGLIWRCRIGRISGRIDLKRRWRLAGHGRNDPVVGVVLFYARIVFRAVWRNGFATTVFRLGHRRGRLHDLFALVFRLLIVGVHSRQLSRHPWLRADVRHLGCYGTTWRCGCSSSTPPHRQRHRPTH